MKRMHDIEITSEGVFINGETLPSGSKLYKHIVSVSGQWNKLTFVSTSPDPVTKDNFTGAVMRLPQVVGFILGNSAYVALPNPSQSGQTSASFTYFYMNSTSSASVDFANASDDVTEL